MHLQTFVLHFKDSLYTEYQSLCYASTNFLFEEKHIKTYRTRGWLICNKSREDLFQQCKKLWDKNLLLSLFYAI